MLNELLGKMITHNPQASLLSEMTFLTSRCEMRLSSPSQDSIRSKAYWWFVQKLFELPG